MSRIYGFYNSISNGLFTLPDTDSYSILEHSDSKPDSCIVLDSKYSHCRGLDSDSDVDPGSQLLLYPVLGLCTGAPLRGLTDTTENITFTTLLAAVTRQVPSNTGFIVFDKRNVMPHLHCRTQIWKPTQIRNPNQMVTLYCAEHFTLHRLGLGSLLPISESEF